MKSIDLTPTQNAPELITGSLRMLADRLLVKPLPWDTATKVIAVRFGDPVRGEVLAVGPGIHPISKRRPSRDGKKVTVDYSKRFRPTEIKVGDIVELGGLNVFDGKGYQFPQVIVNGVRCFICFERDVAIVRDDLRARRHEALVSEDGSAVDFVS